MRNLLGNCSIAFHPICSSPMSNHHGSEAEIVQAEFAEISASIQELAQSYRGDCLALLHLLRLLEALHRDIRDTLFQEALPSNRQALHSLLRDIEAQGGWPYIYRMRLQALMSNMLMDAEINYSVDSDHSSDLADFNSDLIDGAAEKRDWNSELENP